jgi:hypothetical protein
VAAPAKPKAAPAKPAAVAEKPSAPPESESHEQVKAPRRGGGFLRTAPAWLISMLLHIVVLLSMALVVSDPPKKESPRLITSTASEGNDELSEMEEEEFNPEPPAAPNDPTDAVALPDAAVVTEVAVVTTAEPTDVAQVAVEFTDFSSETAAASDLLSAVSAASNQKPGGYGGRSEGERKKRVATGGGTPESEAAVEAALKWMALHQLPDGGWSFDLMTCPSCQGQCSDKASHKEDRIGATALAMLPFLGRGYTHKEGPYKRQLEAGITFLAMGSMEKQGDLTKASRGANMYSQGVAGIVLSESYAMTQDSRLQAPAQYALNFIMDAQDPIRGGWRYAPRQPGDTSAVGWQLMALKSGHMAYLQINPLVIKKAVEFLDFAQADDGAAYGYTGPGNGAGTSAVGLLCRMYLGWKKDHPALQRGVARLAKIGPTHDLYYDYYATQIMHHMEGDIWQAWNTKMRDMLVNAQAKSGHEYGSWHKGLEGGHPVGRLYCTSLATMILEVYYRHLPIYGTKSVDEEFKE